MTIRCLKNGFKKKTVPRDKNVKVKRMRDMPG